MGKQVKRVELQIWREANESGMWRCRVVAPEVRQTVRLDDDASLSAYVADQISMFVQGQAAPANDAIGAES